MNAIAMIVIVTSSSTSVKPASLVAAYGTETGDHQRLLIAPEL